MWMVQVSGSWKVMYFAVFLKPPEVGEVRMVKVSMCEWDARFGTLNS